MEKTLAHALQRASDAEEKEKKTQVALELKERQMTAMEKNFTKAHNDFKQEQARAETAAEALKQRDATISSMVDDIKKLKQKYEALEKKHAALEEEEKKQRELTTRGR
ncbi:hypothetical protein Dimus_038002 [Dionaea muscipula]